MSANITAGKHTMIIDEPTSRHGNDEGMLPLQALMASLAWLALLTALSDQTVQSLHLDVWGAQYVV